MPPGTGDVQLTLAQRAKLAGAVVVSTPQDIALIDARRGVKMFEQVRVPVLGIVENMSYFCCPNCQHRSDIFGHGGAAAEAARIGVPFLGEVPLLLEIRATGDAGTPVTAAAPESDAAKAFAAIAASCAARSARGAENRAAHQHRVMAEIGFYHLTRSDIAAALPPLLGRTLQAGERALVLCPDAAQVAALDEALWRCATPDWLPHGTQATPHPEWQPIFIMGQEVNPAGAAFLFRIGGAQAGIGAYKRVFDLFDGNDVEAVAAARARWREAKQAGHGLTYWKQTAPAGNRRAEARKKKKLERYPKMPRGFLQECNAMSL